jgi:hypothetical protein
MQLDSLEVINFGTVFARIFAYIWCVIKGLFVGILQILATIIAGGYWMPNFYSGLYVSSAIINSIIYDVLITFLIWSCFLMENETEK